MVWRSPRSLHSKVARRQEQCTRRSIHEAGWMEPSSGLGHRCWRHMKCRKDNFHKVRGRRQEQNCPLERQSWGASPAFWHAWAFSTGDGRERCLKRWLSGCLNHSEPQGYLQAHTSSRQKKNSLLNCENRSGMWRCSDNEKAWVLLLLTHTFRP